MKNLSILINKKEIEQINHNLKVFDVKEISKKKYELFEHLVLLLEYAFLKEE